MLIYVIFCFILFPFISFPSHFTFLALYVDTNFSFADDETRRRRSRSGNFSDDLSNNRKSHSSEIERITNNIERYNDAFNFDTVFAGAANRIYNSIPVTGAETNHLHHNLQQKQSAWRNVSSSFKLIPDHLAFRPDSSCSDHPSLATVSLLGVDMDSTSGSQAADLETCFDSAIESAVTTTNVDHKMFDDLFIPDRQIEEEAFFENMKKFSDDQNALDAKNRTKDEKAQYDNLSYRHPPNEPHYPMAFQPQNLLVQTTGKFRLVLFLRCFCYHTNRFLSSLKRQ